MASVIYIQTSYHPTVECPSATVELAEARRKLATNPESKSDELKQHEISTLCEKPTEKPFDENEESKSIP